MTLRDSLYYLGCAVCGVALSIFVFHLGELDVVFGGSDKIYAKTPYGRKFLLPLNSTVRHWSPGGSACISKVANNDSGVLEFTPYDDGLFGRSYSYYSEGYDVKYYTGDGIFIFAYNPFRQGGVESSFRTPSGSCTSSGELALGSFVSTLAQQRKDQK